MKLSLRKHTTPADLLSYESSHMRTAPSITDDWTLVQKALFFTCWFTRNKINHTYSVSRGNESEMM